MAVVSFVLGMILIIFEHLWASLSIFEGVGVDRSSRRWSVWYQSADWRFYANGFSNHRLGWWLANRIGFSNDGQLSKQEKTNHEIGQFRLRCPGHLIFASRCETRWNGIKCYGIIKCLRSVLTSVTIVCRKWRAWFTQPHLHSRNNDRCQWPFWSAIFFFICSGSIFHLPLFLFLGSLSASDGSWTWSWITVKCPMGCDAE